MFSEPSNEIITIHMLLLARRQMRPSPGAQFGIKTKLLCDWVIIMCKQMLPQVIPLWTVYEWTDNRRMAI